MTTKRSRFRFLRGWLMSGRKISVQLTVTYAAAMAITFIIAGFAIERLAHDRISASVNASLRRSARAVTSIVDERLSVGVPLAEISSDTSFSALNPPPWPPRYVQLLDGSARIAFRSRNLGNSILPIDTLFLKSNHFDMVISPDMKLYMYGSRWAEDGSLPFETVEIVQERRDAAASPGKAFYRSEPLRMITARLRPIDGRPVGWVQVAMSLHELERGKEKTRLVLAFIIPSAIILSAFAGWWMSRRFLSPIDNITTAARRIRAEHLHERLAPREVDDELGRLIETLNDLLGRLESSFSQISRFSADASHELRTPLTIVQGEAEVALRKSAMPDEMRQALGVVVDEARRMTHLVADLLTIARLETGQHRPTLSTVPLQPIVEDLAEEAQVMAANKGLTLQLGRVDDAKVLGDPTLLHLVGSNLLQNAVKYTPKGGQVTLSLAAEGRFALLKVRDTGIGIDPSEAPLVFDRFFRSDKVRNRSTSGSGLGLSLVKQVVEAHEGTIDFTSAPGDGSEFVAAIPLAAVAESTDLPDADGPGASRCPG